MRATLRSGGRWSNGLGPADPALAVRGLLDRGCISREVLGPTTSVAGDGAQHLGRKISQLGDELPSLIRRQTDASSRLNSAIVANVELALQRQEVEELPLPIPFGFECVKSGIWM